MTSVSVVIPVYNAEQYIRNCLDSLIRQSLADIEIIVVNDGSIDKTHNVLEEYALKDGRLKVVNQENQGPGIARKNGLKHACGSYILFVDSDDWLEREMLESLYTTAVSEQADVVMCAISNDFERSGASVITSYQLPTNVKLLPGQIKANICASLLRDGSFSSPCNKLFDRNFITRIGLPESNKNYGEDWELMLRVFDTAMSVFYVDKPYYHYVHRSNSSLTKKYRNDRFDEIYVWMYNLSKTYSQKWGLSVKGAAGRFCLQTVASIVNEFSTYNEASPGQIKINTTRYVTHPLVREAIEQAGQLECSFVPKLILFLLKHEQVAAIWGIGLVYRVISSRKKRRVYEIS